MKNKLSSQRFLGERRRKRIVGSTTTRKKTCLPRKLLLSTDALKRLPVCLLIYEATTARISLRPALVLRVERLGPISNGALPVPVTARRIRRHWLSFSLHN